MWRSRQKANGFTVMTERSGSTGSADLDENVDRHTVVIEGIGVVKVPGARPLQRVVVDGTSYTHVATDSDGRWVYRRL